MLLLAGQPQMLQELRRIVRNGLDSQVVQHISRRWPRIEVGHEPISYSLAYVQEEFIAFTRRIFEVFLIPHQLGNGVDKVSAVRCDSNSIGVEQCVQEPPPAHAVVVGSLRPRDSSLDKHVTHSISNGVLFVDAVEPLRREVDIGYLVPSVGSDDFLCERCLINSAPNQLAVTNNRGFLLAETVDDFCLGEPKYTGGVVEAPINTQPARLPILKRNSFCRLDVAFEIPVGIELSCENVPRAFEPGSTKGGRE